MPAAAMAVVLNDSRDQVLLSWRHRFVPDTWNYELPGGLVEDGEDPKTTAIREVVEETGYRPGVMRHLVTFEPMIGMVLSPHHLYLAEGAVKEGRPTEQDEGQFEWVPLEQIPDLITSGMIVNSGTLVGLLQVLALGDAQDPH
jgi:8-oxo-dGTP pyrophosphatase MutT (NUDIX family)